MRRREAVRKRDIHREEQRRLKGAKPYMLLEGDTIDDKGNIIPVGSEEKPKKKAPKKKAEAKKKPAPKKKEKKGEDS